MPKWQAVRSASWAKELLMTFIGATLSIVLTFGTAHFVDQKQKLAEGRQTAMMVIHDIDECIDQLELVRPGKNGSVKSGYLKRVKDN